MEKTIRNLTSTVRLLEEQGVADLDYVSMDIGYDGRVYLLFSSAIPERINGMFVDTAANAEYTALILAPDWQSGAIEETEKLALGKHAMNFRFLRPVPDGSLLLLGSRCMYSEKDGPEKNAVFVDPEGNVLRELTFGDGIADCIVKADGTIITSYFDEGVMGNYGWKEPIGSSGLVAWTAEGEIRASDSEEEEIACGWYDRSEVRKLLASAPFESRTQLYCHLWAKGGLK